MDGLKSCLSAIVLGIVVAVVVHQIWGGTVLVGLVAGPIVIFALYLWLSDIHGGGSSSERRQAAYRNAWRR